MNADDPFDTLEPTILWRHFADFTHIPRPSTKEGQIADYIIAWAGKLPRLESKKDAVGNLRVRVPATKGRESSPTVILQGHLDMVCVRDDTAGPYDPAKGKIRVFRATKKGDTFVETKTGEWIKADKTTLGADDGIGVAAMLTVVEDKAAVHGPLELLFTVDEETGLTGAFQLDVSLITGRTCLNLDSEEDDSIIIGSAGGRNTTITWSRKPTATPPEQVGATLKISGLRGGHSGVDINSGRLNAIHALARVLYAASGQVGLRISSVGGGFPPNAIAREATAVLAIPGKSEPSFRDAVERERAAIARQYQATEPDVKLDVEKPGEIPGTTFSVQDFQVLIDMMRAIPSGVIAMSQKLPGLVETSNNLGGLKTTDDSVTIVCSSRSSVSTALDEITDRLGALARLGNATAECDTGYPGWDPNPASPILSIVEKAYRRLFSVAPRVTAVHAGLECGVIRAKVPTLDVVSVGPTIFGAHSIQEAVNIKSVGKFYQLLVAVLGDLAANKPK